MLGRLPFVSALTVFPTLNEKFDSHQINSGQIWCKKVQSKVKDKDGKYAFAVQFTATKQQLFAVQIKNAFQLFLVTTQPFLVVKPSKVRDS